MDDGKKPRVSVFERNPRKTLLFAALALVAAADVTVGTLLARGREGIGAPDPHFHHGLRPMRRASARWGDAEYPVYTNSLGFVDYENRKVPLKKPAGRTRLLIIGDSFLEGMGMPYRMTVGGALAADLGPGWDVLNAGVASYSPKLYYLKTRWLLEKRKLEFDRLAVFIDISDIQDELVYEAFNPDSGGYSLLRSVYVAARDHSALFPFLVKRLKVLHGAKAAAAKGTGKSELLRWSDESVYYSERGIWTDEGAVAWRDDGLRLAAENMGKLCDLARARGIPVTIVVYPWPHQVRARREDCPQPAFWRKFAAARGAQFISLYPDYLKGGAEAAVSRYFIRGDVHWNAEGNRLTASRVAAELRKASAAR